MSWSIVFQRLLKEHEISDFQALLYLLSSKRVLNLDDRSHWSLNPGNFLVKCLSAHLTSSSPLEKRMFKALCKSSSPRRVNILIWIMLFGLLNYSSIMQRKILSSCLLPSVCPQFALFVLRKVRTYCIYF